MSTKEVAAPAPSRALAVVSVEEMQTMAKTVAQSKLFPSAPTPEAAFALMLLCQSEGLHPMQAMRRFHIIQGRASMKADAILAEFMERGGKVEWKDYTNEKVTGVFEAPGLSKPATITWTKDDAVKAKLWEKDNWKTYPRQMLKARVVSDGVRMSMPAVMVGIVSAEEAEDLPPLVFTAGPAPEVPRRAAPAAAPVVEGEIVTERETPAPASETPAPGDAQEEAPLGEPAAPALPPAPAGEQVVHTGIENITYKAVPNTKPTEYDYWITGFKGIIYHTRERKFANALKLKKDKGAMALIWFKPVTADGFESLEITRAE